MQCGDRLDHRIHRPDDADVLLAAREELTRLANLGTLQMPDFERDFFAKRRRGGKRRDKVSVAVALDHLGSDRGRVEVEFGANTLFDFRPDGGKRSHRARATFTPQSIGGGTARSASPPMTSVGTFMLAKLAQLILFAGFCPTRLPVMAECSSVAHASVPAGFAAR